MVQTPMPHFREIHTYQVVTTVDLVLSTAKSIDKILDKSKHKSVFEKDINLSDIIDKYIKNNIPVLIWATMDMKKSKKPEHGQ